VVTIEREGLTEFLSVPPNPIATVLPLPDRDDIETTVGILIAVTLSTLTTARLPRGRMGRKVRLALRGLLWQVQKLGKPS
jgi:hypothetical protein